MREPTRKRETPRDRRLREAYEQAMQAQRDAGARARRNAETHGVPLNREPRKQAHADGVETEHEAAAANPAGKATNARRCLEAHAEAHRNYVAAGGPPYTAGLTDDEVGAILGLPDIEANRRCSGLRDDRLIEWLLETSGDGHPSMVSLPVTRRTRKGRRARVSVITELGRRVLS